MAPDNDNHIVEHIGAELQERLPVDHRLPGVLAALMRELCEAEQRYNIQGVLGRFNKRGL